MFEDSNKEYTGSSAGVAGNKPVTPVSLSAAQEAAIQAVVASAFQQLQQQQSVADAQAVKTQLYALAREMSASQRASLDPRLVMERWQQTKPNGLQSSPASRAVDGQAVTPSNVGPQPADFSATQTATPSAKSTDFSAGQSEAGGGVSEDADATTAQSDGGITATDTTGGTPADAASTPAGEKEVDHSQAVTAATSADAADNAPASEQVAGQSDQPADAGSPDQAAGASSQSDAPSGSQKPENASPGSAAEQPADGQKNSLNDETTPAGQTTDSEAAARPGQSDVAGQAQSGNSASAQTRNTAPVAGNGQEAVPPMSQGVEKSGPTQEPSAQTDHATPEKQGLPTGARDRFKRGFEDRKSGKGFKDAYSARKLPPGGTAAKGLGEGAAKGAAENLAKEGAKDVAQTAAKAAAKEGVKDTAKLASKTTPVGLLTDIDAKGAYKAAKDLKDFKVVSAAKGAVQSGAVTLFRVSYDPWVIGFTWGLSLIVTLIVGSVIFFVPSSSMSFLERLLVVALWILLLLVVLLALGLTLISLCNGPAGWAVWAASWFSNTAADINKFCEPIGALQAATKR